jgi:glutamine synthetase
MPYGKSASPQEALTFLEQHPAVRAIDVLLADSSGVLRGKRVEREGLAAVYHQGFSLPGSMFALDIQGGTIQATGLGFDEGDADRPCLPIPGSLVATPWLGEGVAQVQVAMFETDGVTPFYADCRHVLESILDRFAAKGLKPVVAVELEFYLVDKERAASGHAQPPRSPRTGRREYRTQINAMADLDDWSAFLEEVDRVAAIQNVPATGSLTEYGPGQMEVNLQHGTQDPTTEV